MTDTLLDALLALAAFTIAAVTFIRLDEILMWIAGG
jgi:hypothetical protein